MCVKRNAGEAGYLTWTAMHNSFIFQGGPTQNYSAESYYKCCIEQLLAAATVPVGSNNAMLGHMDAQFDMYG